MDAPQSRTPSLSTLGFSAGYVASIAAVNWGFSVAPLVQLPNGEFWPPMSLAVGFTFVLRDFAQREIGHGVLAAMALGGLLSWWMADPFIALASVAAFAVSELADWALYTFSGRPFAQRVLWSSVVSTPVDSAVFLALIGHLSLSGVLVMTASKMLGALVVFFLTKRSAHV